MKINGFGMGVSLLIFFALLYMAYNYGKNGKLIGM
jgi:hypothetical protein